MEKLVVLVVVILSATSIYAGNYANVIFEKDKTFVLDLNDKENPYVEIEIRDLNGKVLHSENYQTLSIASKKYNLKNLPNGTYEMVIQSKMGKTIYPMTVTFDGVKMSPVSNHVNFKPIITYENDLIEFSQLTLGRDVTFTLSDKEGIFYTKNYKNEASINANFSASKLPAGDYTVTITSNDQDHTYSFKK